MNSLNVKRTLAVGFFWLAGAVAALAQARGQTHTAPADAATPPPVASQPLTVVVTIKPIHALAAAVLGDTGTAELLIDGAASPHTYALKPSQVRRLNEAHVVVMVSDDLETFMRKVVASLPKATRVARLDQAANLTRLPVRAGGVFEADDHAHAHAHKREKDGHGKHGHGSRPPGPQPTTGVAIDAHLWLDPLNGKAILTHLAGVFGEADPAQRVTYERNARAMAERLDRLQEDLGRELQPVATKPFIVMHDAYQYFEQRFGLTVAGSITLNPEVQPGAKRLQQLRGRLRSGGVVCVFAEPQFESKLVGTLIEGTKVRRGTLDPIGAALPAGPGAYEGLLRGLAADLRGCLGGTS